MKTNLKLYASLLMILYSIVLLILNYPHLRFSDYVFLFTIGLLGCYGFVYQYRQLSRERRGQPAEDEFSKRAHYKSGAVSFRISYILWLLIMVLSSRVKMDTDEIFLWGLIGMTLIFVLTRAYYNHFGLKDE